MDWTSYLLIGSIIFAVLALIFRRYISALIEDYVLDLGLSTLDTFAGGAVGLDWGDWIAAIIIFVREKKVTGWFVAGIAAWEATNLIPFSLIPVGGEVLEVVTNFIPTVTISRFLFSKFNSADKNVEQIERHIKLAKKFNIKVSEQEMQLKGIKKLIKDEDPGKAIEETKKLEKKLNKKIAVVIQDEAQKTEQAINEFLDKNPEGEQNLIDELTEAITAAENLLKEAAMRTENADFETAIQRIQQAQQILIESEKEYEAAKVA
jgi:hypothetical protein